MSTYEPGTVAIATVRGVPNVRAFRVEESWLTAGRVEEWFEHDDSEVTDIRPLVVLDLDELVSPQVLANYVRVTGLCGSKAIGEVLADQIEAQTKPPRIPEPGWSGVVEAHTAQNSDRLRWQRDSGDHAGHWVCEDPLEYDRTWEVLIDPTLVRPGIEDES